MGHPRFLYYLFDRLQRYRAKKANVLYWQDFKRNKMDLEQFSVDALDPRRASKTISRFNRFMSAGG